MLKEYQIRKIIRNILNEKINKTGWLSDKLQVKPVQRAMLDKIGLWHGVLRNEEEKIKLARVMLGVSKGDPIDGLWGNSTQSLWDKLTNYESLPAGDEESGVATLIIIRLPHLSESEIASILKPAYNQMVKEDEKLESGVTLSDREIASTKKPTSLQPDLDFYKAVLAELGAPATEQNLIFMSAWGASENTDAQYNPLATTLPYHKSTWSRDPGMTVFNTLSGGPGVKNYSTFEAGVYASARTLYSGKGMYYKNIREKLIDGGYDALDIASHTDELSKWVGKRVSAYTYDLIAKGKPGPINRRKGPISTSMKRKKNYT